MQRWTVHLEGGPRRVNHAGVTIGHNIFSFGGYCTGDDFEVTRPMDIHIFSTVSYKWTALPVPGEGAPQFEVTPFQRYGHTAVKLDDRAYIWGGRNDKDGADNTLYCFNPVTLQWTNPVVFGQKPGERDGHSACIINRKMYIFGGYEEFVEKFSNEVHALDFQTMTWSLIIPQGPTKPARWRDFHSAVGVGDEMLIFGGRSDRAGPYHTNNEVYCHKLQVFNTAELRWSEPVVNGHIPTGRRSHSALAAPKDLVKNDAVNKIIGSKLPRILLSASFFPQPFGEATTTSQHVLYRDQMYIFGGYNGIHDVHFGDMFKFNPETRYWSVIKICGDGPCPRRRQCCCLVDDRLFVFGGTSPCVVPMEGTEFDLMDHSDLHVLDFAPSLRTLCLLAVANSDLDTTCLPADVRWELNAMTTNSTISRPLNSSG